MPALPADFEPAKFETTQQYDHAEDVTKFDVVRTMTFEKLLPGPGAGGDRN